jgi:hypothetical protein
VNSEELEVSLRSEFETYLKNILAEKQQEIAQLQEQVTAELERHKTQLDEVFTSAVSNFAKEYEFEASFKESVVEHLRLARDEGAQITAMAIARAEELEKDSASMDGGKADSSMKEIYEAVSEISNKPSQSEILKSLVHHAGNFAPRGAFFIVKNEHLVGWRTFGKEKGETEEKVREVFLAVGADSVLSESVKTLSTVTNQTGGFNADAEIFRKLEFGEPSKMVAVPLVARGRGVAVLYADYGNEGANINVEAIETLVRVAGLTVEVLASSKSTVNKKVSDRKVEDYSASEVSIGETGGLPSEVLANYQSYASVPTTATVAEPAYENYSAPAAVAVQEAESPINQTTDFNTDYSQTNLTTDYSQVEESATGYAPAQEFQETPATDYAPIAETEESATAFSDYSTGTAVEETPTTEFSDYSTETEVEETPATEFSDVPSAQEFESNVPTSGFEGYSNESEPIAKPTETPAFETSSWSAPVEEKVETDYAKDYSYQTEAEEKYPAFETSSWSASKETAPGFSAQEFAQNFAKETDPTEYAKDFSYQAQENEPVKDYDFQSPTTATEPTVQTETPVEEFVPTKEQTFEVENGKTEAATPKSRLSERNVDLPIEVGEDERRLHNDARRFARLLVSEIKLYNEQKVKEGRDSSDLYERLKEAIDRSREMYDKRVQPPVAAKFDYFHYELVNTLAEGDDNKLGAEYPGAAA